MKYGEKSQSCSLRLLLEEGFFPINWKLYDNHIAFFFFVNDNNPPNTFTVTIERFCHHSHSFVLGPLKDVKCKLLHAMCMHTHTHTSTTKLKSSRPHEYKEKRLYWAYLFLKWIAKHGIISMNKMFGLQLLIEIWTFLKLFLIFKKKNTGKCTKGVLVLPA